MNEELHKPIPSDEQTGSSQVTSESRTRSFRRVSCILCQGKVYLETFPKTPQESTEFQNYLDYQVLLGLLGAWQGEGGSKYFDEYTYTCPACMNDSVSSDTESVTVRISLRIETAAWEAFEQELGDVTGLCNVEQNAKEAHIEWATDIPKSKIKSFYMMLRVLAGLDMPMNYNQGLVMFVNEVEYPEPAKDCGNPDVI